jgi:hypothetical protein
MTQVCDLLKLSPHFMRSVNLERDFSDARSLDGYIVTAETQAHLKQLGNGLRKESGQRAWYLTGDFGSGKSSFALLLASLLGRPAGEIPWSLRELYGVLGVPAKFRRYLPVLVTGSREIMSHAVLRGLVESLNLATPSKQKLASRTKAAKLLAQDQIQDRDVVALIEEVAAELVNSGQFGGILLIIDELGKFLEYAALNPDAQDVFFLQSLAEAAARSKTAPIQLLGLLHQGIAEYAEKLSLTAQREWAKIGERFGTLHFTQPLGQIATLLAAALGVDSDRKELKAWKKIAFDDMTSAIELGLFGPAPGTSELRRLAPSLYPLHPTVIPVLARFFRRFGQNERSLFSFLLSTEPFALRAFAEQEASSDSLYRLSHFYDFAAYNFGQRLGQQSFRSHWGHIDAVVRGAGDQPPLTQRLLKTIGILNVLQEENLCPTLETLTLALGADAKLKELLTKLCQRGLLYHRSGVKGYSLWPSASVNLEQRSIAASDAVIHPAPIAEIVQEKLDNRPVVARRYYIQTGNLRYVDVRYVTSDEFCRGGSDLKFQYPSDGLLVVVICETAAQCQKAETAARGLNGRPLTLIAVTPPLESLGSYSLNLERWLWVERTTPELKDDRFAAEEVDRQVKAAETALDQRLREHISFRGTETRTDGKGVVWFCSGEKLDGLTKQEESLQAYLSEQFGKLFDQAPQIRNELVNRHTLSSSAAAARQKLFDRMLKDGGKPLLGLPEDRYPPEKSIYLSILAAGNLHRAEKEKWAVRFPSADHDPLNLRPALEAVLEKLEEVPDRRVPVAELYDLLRTKPFGVRDGLIPILLLTVFLVYETEIAIYEDNVFQPEVEEFLMMRLARRPETFEFQLCRINGVRKALISELAAVVQAERAESSHLLSIVRPLYQFVAGLPEYARNTDQLSPETLALRKAIDAAREPADLVFNELPKALGFEPKSKGSADPTALAKKLGQSITDLRRCFPELQNRMAAAILHSFRHDGPLQTWRESIAESAETVLVGLGEPELRAFCLKLIDTENPEPDWLEALGSLLVRVPPSRWRDRDEVAFRERIETFARQFERVLATCFLRDGSLPETAIRIAVTPRSGLEKELVVSLTPKQASETEALLAKLRQHLPADPDNISLAALSRLLWDQLQKKA